jgi:outer membrane lipoprotein-sorting protein
MKFGFGARRARLLAAGLLAATLGWAHPAQAEGTTPSEARDITLSPRQVDFLRKAEAEINALHTLKSRFLQATTNGDLSEGIVYMSRPGRLRVEYDPPMSVLVVADGFYFTFVDTKLQQMSYLDFDATPAGLLLQKKLELSGPTSRVRAVKEFPGGVEISVVSRKDPTSGMLTLVFTKAPFALAQWRVTDAQGIVTTVTLQNPETGVRLPESLFARPSPP